MGLELVQKRQGPSPKHVPKQRQSVQVQGRTRVGFAGGAELVRVGPGDVGVLGL